MPHSVHVPAALDSTFDPQLHHPAMLSKFQVLEEQLRPRGTAYHIARGSRRTRDAGG